MEGMFDIKAINEQIGGTGNNIYATRKDKLRADIQTLEALDLDDGVSEALAAKRQKLQALLLERPT